MDTYVTDEERVEQIKKWWAENGNYLIAGVVIGVGLLVGWNVWKQSKVNHSGDASALYSQVQSAVETGKSDTLMGNLETLNGDFSDTVYAPLAQLQVAKFYVTNGDLPKAEIALKNAVASGAEISVADLAQLRLARVLLSQHKVDEALTAVNAVTDATYVSLREEIRGDILVKQGDVAKAREAFATALLSAGARAEFLQLKLDNLGSE